MVGILNDAVKIDFLNWRMSDPFWSDVWVGLGTADFTPDQQSVLADFVEGLWLGYLRVQLSAPWTYAVLMPDGQTLTAQPAITFRNTGLITTPTIYTWFWYTPTTSRIVMARRFDVPFTLPSGGNRSLVPYYSLRSEESP